MSKSSVWEWKRSEAPARIVTRTCPCPCARTFDVDVNKHPQRRRRFYEKACSTRLRRASGHKDKPIPSHMRGRREVLGMPERVLVIPEIGAMV